MLNLLQYLFFKRKGAKFFRKARKVLPPSLSCWGNEASHKAFHTQFVMLKASLLCHPYGIFTSYVTLSYPYFMPNGILQKLYSLF